MAMIDLSKSYKPINKIPRKTDVLRSELHLLGASVSTVVKEINPNHNQKGDLTVYL